LQAQGLDGAAFQNAEDVHGVHDGQDCWHDGVGEEDERDGRGEPALLDYLHDETFVTFNVVDVDVDEESDKSSVQELGLNTE
jgi:hypothetical protein